MVSVSPGEGKTVSRHIRVLKIECFQVKKKLLREVMTAVLSRGSKMCSFIELQGLKLVYKRYASLYFCCAIGISKFILCIRDRQMKSFSLRPPARDGHTTLIFVQLSHLRSNLDSDFAIEAHLGANSLGGQSPKLASRAKISLTQSFEVRFGFRLHH